MVTNVPQLMTVKQAAFLLGRHKNTIYRMVKTGKLRKRSNGSGERSYGIVAEDVEAIINPPQPITRNKFSLRELLKADRLNRSTKKGN